MDKIPTICLLTPCNFTAQIISFFYCFLCDKHRTGFVRAWSNNPCLHRPLRSWKAQGVHNSCHGDVNEAFLWEKDYNAHITNQDNNSPQKVRANKDLCAVIYLSTKVLWRWDILLLYLNGCYNCTIVCCTTRVASCLQEMHVQMCGLTYGQRQMEILPTISNAVYFKHTVSDINWFFYGKHFSQISGKSQAEASGLISLLS